MRLCAVSADSSFHRGRTDRLVGWEVVLAVEGDGSHGRVILEDRRCAIPVVDVAVHDSHSHLQ